MKQNKICIAKLLESHEATTWESRTVVFERSEFTGLDLFGSFCIKTKTNKNSNYTLLISLKKIELFINRLFGVDSVINY